LQQHEKIILDIWDRKLIVYTLTDRQQILSGHTIRQQINRHKSKLICMQTTTMMMVLTPRMAAGTFVHIILDDKDK
jgi:hypothetical protein